MSGGKVEALWIKRAVRGPMDAAAEVTLVEDSGVLGSANQGGWRQVTVIEKEVFDRLAETLSPEVDPSMRRANVMTSGIQLEGTRGMILRLGECRIELRGETHPCEQMDEAIPGLRDALRPRCRGGMFGKIIKGGVVRVGDFAELEQGNTE